MIELLTSPEAWIAFATLTALELVLGIDNIIFISILVDKLPKERQEMARRLGLSGDVHAHRLLLVLAGSSAGVRVHGAGPGYLAGTCPAGGACS